MSFTIDRNQGIGGSDAKRIIDGDWFRLWQEKTQRALPADLSDVFPVQLGKHTESFHIEWFCKRKGFALETQQDYYRHPDLDWMFAHLDGWLLPVETFVEVKHSNASATLRDRAEYYMPQLQHQMHVTSRTSCWFSVILGNQEPVFAEVQYELAYMEKLLELELAFWWHVQNDEPPLETPAAKISAAKDAALDVHVDKLRRVQMDGNNHWTSLATRYLELKPQAKEYETVSAQLKELVEFDVGEAAGAGIQIKRDKKGSLRLTETR